MPTPGGQPNSPATPGRGVIRRDPKVEQRKAQPLGNSGTLVVDAGRIDNFSVTERCAKRPQLEKNNLENIGENFHLFSEKKGDDLVRPDHENNIKTKFPGHALGHAPADPAAGASQIPGGTPGNKGG